MTRTRIYNSMRHVDGYAVVDPRAIACAWGWEP